jgi:hypothetical protein
MDFPYQNIAVFRDQILNYNIPFLNEILNTVRYCPCKMSLIENVLLRDLGKIVMDYEKEKTVHYFNRGFPLTPAGFLLKMYNPGKQEDVAVFESTVSALSQNETDILLTDSCYLTNLRKWFIGNPNPYIKHIHVYAKPLKIIYRKKMELLVLPMNCIHDLRHSRRIVKEWNLGSAEVFFVYTSNGACVIDLREQKLYFNEKNVNFMKFKSWSSVSLPLK